MICIRSWRWLNMFNKDYKIRGMYATHLKSLAQDKSVRDKTTAEKPFLFDRYIDVYMNAAIIGLLMGQPIVKPDYSSNDSAQILASAFIGEQEKCRFLYRMVMLLDKTRNLSADEKINRAFRFDENAPKKDPKIEEGMSLFNAYVLAGIEIMYENIALDATNTDELCINAHKMMEDFQDELTETSPDELLNRLRIHS